MPLGCQVFTLVGLISRSEDNRFKLAKPPPCQHACSPFGQWPLPCKREMWHFPASASGAEQGYRRRARAECTDFPSPLVPRDISLGTVPWTHRPPLVPKLSLLSSLGRQKKKDLWSQHAVKMEVPKKWLLRPLSLCRSLKLHPGSTCTMRVEER